MEAGDELRLAPLHAAPWHRRLLAALHRHTPGSLLADVSQLKALPPASDGISVRVLQNWASLGAPARRRAVVVTSEASCELARAAVAAGGLVLCGRRALAGGGGAALGRWDALAGRFVGGGAGKLPLFGLLGATLRVATVEYPPYVMHYNDSRSAITAGEGELNAGVELQILAVIRRQAGARLILRDYGEDSWNRILGAVRAARADVALGGLFAKQSRLAILDMSAQYWTENVNWFLPAPRPRPHWQSFAHAFPAHVWLLFALAQTAAALISRALSRRYAESPPCCLQLLGTVLGISVGGQPRNWPLRFFFYSWLLYCQQINALFQTSLTAVMTDPGYEASINSVEELVTSGWTAISLPGLMTFMREAQDARINTMLLRMRRCTSLHECVHRLVSRREKCLAAPRRGFQFELAVNFPLTMITKYKMLSEDVISSGTVMYFCKNSPIKKPINRLLSWIVESGLTEKWNRDILAVTRVNKYLEHVAAGNDEGSEESDDERYTPLNLENMKGVFAVFFLGHIFGLLTFIIELLHHRNYKPVSHLPKVKKRKISLMCQAKGKSIHRRYSYNKKLAHVRRARVFLFHKAAYSNNNI